jgi:mannosyltransferase
MQKSLRPLARSFKAHWPFWLVLGLTLAGAWLRLWHLGRDGLWRDEAQGLFVAAKTFPGGIAAALVQDGHPPMYFFLMHFWLKLFGGSEFSVRLPSALLGIATIPLLYRMGKDMFDRNVGLLAAAVAAFLPMHILVSRQARMYTLFPLLVLLSMWTLYGAVTRNTVRLWLGYVLSTALMLYSHNWAVLVFAAQGLFMVVQWLARSRSIEMLGKWLGTQAGAFLLFAPWVPTLVEQLRIPGIVMGPWVHSENGFLGTMVRLGNELTSMTWPADAPIPYVLLIAAGLITVGISLRTVKVEYTPSPALDLTTLLLAAPVIAGVVLTTATNGLIPSYVTMAVFPALCLVLARALTRLRLPYALMGLAVLGLMFWRNPIAGQYGTPQSTLREIAAFVTAQAGPRDVIIIAPDYYATTFNHYFAGNQPQLAFPEPPGRVEEIVWTGWRDRWVNAAQAVQPALDFVAQNLVADARVWLIAPLDAYPQDASFNQIRAVKAGLDAKYQLMTDEGAFKGAVERADVLAYRLR